MRQFQVPLEQLKNYRPEPDTAQTGPGPGPAPHWNCSYALPFEKGDSGGKIFHSDITAFTPYMVVDHRDALISTLLLG
jgi:hypothetical protein